MESMNIFVEYFLKVITLIATQYHGWAEKLSYFHQITTE